MSRYPECEPTRGDVSRVIQTYQEGCTVIWTSPKWAFCVIRTSSEFFLGMENQIIQTFLFPSSGSANGERTDGCGKKMRETSQCIRMQGKIILARKEVTTSYKAYIYIIHALKVCCKFYISMYWTVGVISVAAVRQILRFSKSHNRHR